MKQVIVDGFPYTVEKVLIVGGKRSRNYDRYAGCVAYLHVETDTVFIAYPYPTSMLACNVDGKPMIPLFASDFEYTICY